VVVLGAPHSANAEILTRWGRDRGWRVIEPPGVEQILNRDTAWLEQFEGQSSPWVLPRLERCYLRHPRGLLLVQRLLERLSHGHGGHCVVGCDSWTWAYLAHVPPGTKGIGRCLVAQAFDRHRLARWLQPDRPEGAEPIRVLEAGSDQPILDQSDAEEASEADVEGSGFLKHLAAYSLGIPEVAQTIWMSVLRRVGATRPEDTQLRHEFRLPAWRQLELPVPPKDARDHAIVLHALLLHNGLAEDLLPRLLPLSDSEINLSLHRLGDARLVERVEQSWRISATGYPAVRKLLDDEGYLTDDLA